jgi:hypothetical protein
MGMNSIRDLIADDSFAIGFQSMGQYRTALLKALDVTPPAPKVGEAGEVGELVAALEADAECVTAGQPDLMQLTDKQLTRIAQLLKTSTQPADIDPGFSADLLRYEFSVHDNHDMEVAGGDAATFGEVLAEGRHYLSQYSQDGPHRLEFRCVQVMDYAEPANA